MLAQDDLYRKLCRNVVLNDEIQQKMHASGIDPCLTPLSETAYYANLMLKERARERFMPEEGRDSMVVDWLGTLLKRKGIPNDDVAFIICAYTLAVDNLINNCEDHLARQDKETHGREAYNDFMEYIDMDIGLTKISDLLRPRDIPEIDALLPAKDTEIYAQATTRLAKNMVANYMHVKGLTDETRDVKKLSADIEKMLEAQGMENEQAHEQVQKFIDFMAREIDRCYKIESVLRPRGRISPDRGGSRLL